MSSSRDGGAAFGGSALPRIAGEPAVFLEPFFAFHASFYFR